MVTLATRDFDSRCDKCGSRDKGKGYWAPEKKTISSNRGKNGQGFKKYNPHVDLVSGWQVTVILVRNIQIKIYFF
jgi:hypothetical protein